MSASATSPHPLLDRFADSAERARRLLDEPDAGIATLLFVVLFVGVLMRLASLYVRWKAGALPTPRPAQPRTRRASAAGPRTARADRMAASARQADPGLAAATACSAPSDAPPYGSEAKSLPPSARIVQLVQATHRARSDARHGRLWQPPDVFQTSEPTSPAHAHFVP